MTCRCGDAVKCLFWFEEKSRANSNRVNLNGTYDLNTEKLKNLNFRSLKNDIAIASVYITTVQEIGQYLAERLFSHQTLVKWPLVQCNNRTSTPPCLKNQTR